MLSPGHEANLPYDLTPRSKVEFTFPVRGKAVLQCFEDKKYCLRREGLVFTLAYRRPIINCLPAMLEISDEVTIPPGYQGPSHAVDLKKIRISDAKSSEGLEIHKEKDFILVAPGILI
jgi:hypothetical protein